ncbi:Mu transposase C-terminal domain-containing protein [Oceanobacillus oncorhynchi]|uniref:Mu transposase C-terminal domain-containing protein n=1 Tax=Oceanobacillus oncorhynchi TaxID=545501 RepID=UPI0034D455A7
MLTLNTLIKYNENSENVERVIYNDVNGQHCYLINIFDNSFPVLRETEAIEYSLRNKEAEILENDPWSLFVLDKSISNKAKVVQEKAWNVVSALLAEGEKSLLQSATRNPIIHRISIDLRINRKTALKYLKRYWKRGMTPLSLLPDFYKRGGKGQQKQSNGKKRGRPRKVQDIFGSGINIDENIKKVFRLAAEKYYLTKRDVSVRFAYEQMIKEFFKEELEESPGKLPTYYQFLYWLRKEQKLSKEIIRRTGKRNYDLNFRPVLGSSKSEVRSPGEKIQIDATIADVYLVSEFNREWVIGRPVLYFCKCVWSSMIVGFHVGLEGPNFEQARLALMNIVEDKVEYCKQFDIEINKKEWPTAYLPNSIVADRAELLSNASNLLTEKLNVRIENTGAWRGDLKSLIERQFGLLTNEVVKPLLPGAVDKDFGKRGTKDHRLSGKLTLDEFKKIIIKYILYFNNQYVMESFIRDEEMIKEEVEPIPINLWEWGMKNRSGRLRKISKELMMLHMLPNGNATVTESGIRFRHMLYSSELALKEQWFVKARYDSSWKIDIVYDPRNMDKIYIQNPDNNSYEVCPLLEHQLRYKNRSIEDINFLHELENIQKRSHKQEQLKAKINLKEEVEKIVKEAEQKSKSSGVKESDNKRIKNIKEHRKLEQELIRKKENEILKNESNAELTESTVIPMNDSAENENYLLLKSMQKKGMKDRE